MAIWRCGRFTFDLEQGPLIMGILNVTPDSFSDGYPSPVQAVARAYSLIEQGADIIDIGGESTRPGAAPVSLDEELRRIMPVVEALCKLGNLPLSVDTQKAEVAKRVLDAGAAIINHVSASLDVGKMLPVLQASNAGYVAMHLPSRPATMQDDPRYSDVVGEVGAALRAIHDFCQEQGVSPERILFDPGIGFGKTLEHNKALMAATAQLAKSIGRPLLMGISRKSWIGHWFSVPVENQAVRDSLSCLASVLFPADAVAVHRVHEVGLLRRSLELAKCLQAERPIRQ